MAIAKTGIGASSSLIPILIIKAESKMMCMA